MELIFMATFLNLLRLIFKKNFFCKMSKIMLSQKLYKTNWKIAIPYACMSVLTYAYKCCAEALKYGGFYVDCSLG